MAKKRVKKAKFDSGKLAFFFGVVLSVFVGIFFGLSPDLRFSLGLGITYSIIFILGLIVGLLNITVKETNEFLLASITFLAAGTINVVFITAALPQFGGVVQQIFSALSIFVAPAAIVVASKALFELARRR